MPPIAQKTAAGILEAVVLTVSVTGIGPL
jgi:hypothetical protein